MQNKHYTTKFFSPEAWMFLLLTLCIQFVMVNYVDLTPHVDENFFFSSSDPNYQDDMEISRLFARQDSQVIISVEGDIYSADYFKKIKRLTKILSDYDEVKSVKSLSSGPKSLDDALRSPLWKRALLSENLQSSNILVILKDEYSSPLIARIENLISAMQEDDFVLRISGFPFIVELIKRNLTIDLYLFSKLSLLIFGIVVLAIFHSWRILIGMVVACINAGALAFMINQLLGFRVGILTANLATIIFVLTLSHIVFLTFNWKHLHTPESELDQYQTVKHALDLTVPASFWSMFTTFLGFLSLLFVEAKPLRELGVTGGIGTAVAFLSAFIIYPEFLRLKKYPHDWSERETRSFYHKTFRFFDRNYAFLIIGIVGIVILTFPSLTTLQTDPSLFSYFETESEITNGLEFIDENGGSSPLVIVVKSHHGKLLNTRKMINRLWKLQKELEKKEDIGTIISLPTLVSEGKRNFLGKFLSSETLLTQMEKEKYDQITDSFVTRNRQYGLFLIRMKENGRTGDRLDVIDRIKSTINAHKFSPHLIGGVYAQQGYLSSHVASSLIYGLGRLILAFALIGFLVSLSLRIGMAMTFSIGIIPLCILGCVGYFKIPLDIISAPASNVAIAMGIDAMIHMVHAYRRLEKNGKHRLSDWLKVRRRMWEPIVTSMFVICAGFGIFLFSSFPPTQRFGVAIVFGTVCAATSAIFIFPLIAKRY